MSIVKMKHLSLQALNADRDTLLLRLQRVGCVELSAPESGGDWIGRAVQDSPQTEETAAALAKMQTSLALLDQYAPEKKGLLTPLPELTAEELFADNPTAERAAQLLPDLGEKRNRADSEAALIAARLEGLRPWAGLDLSLDQTGSRHTTLRFLTLPAVEDLVSVREALSGKTDGWELIEASCDRNFRYLLLICHRAVEETVTSVLQRFSASTVTLPEEPGTAAETISALEDRLTELCAARETAEAEIAAMAPARSELRRACDRLEQDLARERERADLLCTKNAFLAEGWVPEEDVPRLERLLGGFVCSWQLRDPTEEEIPAVPVRLKNNRLTRCMNAVTEMYSLPAYDGIDPNPLMAPFFILFFGIMMADMGYGLLMIAAGAIVLKKAKPKGTMLSFMELVFWCGISTFVLGAMTGGFFGDFIPQLCRLIDPDSTFEMPALFTPLDDTVAIMIGSLILGLIQIFTGMTVSVVYKIKNGDLWDAVFDEFTWWTIMGGIVLAIFGIGSPGGVPVVLVIGCLMLALGGTRNARGLGKLTSLIGLVYNGVTGYFGDILSYIRLMALMLAGSVIAQVFNTLGSAFGNVILFVIVSMVGNALNLALNLLGCYVHDLRLQCLEFFNRFYREGGNAYCPLSLKTNYVNMKMEEE